MVEKVNQKLGYPPLDSPGLTEQSEIEDLQSKVSAIYEFMQREMIPVIEKLRITLGLTMDRFSSGAGSPEGVVLADNGAIYLNSTGGGGTRVYLKTTSGVNTGWTAVL